jgi:type I restriction enzyme S subunit
MKYEYKNSGIEWIGEVPKHWKKEKIFRAAEFITSGGTPRSGNEEFYEGDIYWIQSGDLNDGYITETEKKITKEGLENSSAKLFPKNTLLVAMYGATIGKLGIQTMEAATNQACCAIFPAKKVELKFLFYFFNAVKDKYISDSYGGGQPNISQSLIKQTYLFIPNKPEQTAIAAYLDKACADIDRVVEIKRKQINNLQQQLKSIIHQTVTKGLDKNVELKESGIEWIGKVPKLWRKEKIYRAAEFISSGGTPSSGNEEYYFEGNIFWIQSGDLNDSYITETEKKITIEGLNNSSAKLFPKNTLLVAMYGATIGKLGIQTMEAATNQACCAIFPVKRIELKFLFYFFHAIKDKYISDSYGGGQPNISQSLIKQTYFFVPDNKEQTLIFEYLDKELEKIKTVQSKIEKQIETLVLYKKSLIHEVVTGKKQVFGVN